MHGVDERRSLLPSLHDNEVVVASVVWPSEAFAAEPLAALLDDDERLRAARFRYEKDRDSFLVSRGLLRACLAVYMHVDAHQVRFSYAEEGKPQLDPKHHADRIEFNLSHSDGLIAIVFSRSHRVGIDVEKPRQVLDELEIAERYFTETEASRLRSLLPAERRNAFLAAWTRREAFAKATGRGLSDILEQSNPTTIATEMEAFSFHSLPFEPEHVGVVAIEGNVPSVRHIRITSLTGLL